MPSGSSIPSRMRSCAKALSSTSRARRYVRSHLPRCAQAGADSLSTIERDQVIEMRRDTWKKSFTRGAQARLHRVQSRTGSPVKELVVSVVNKLPQRLHHARLTHLSGPALRGPAKELIGFDFAPAAFSDHRATSVLPLTATRSLCRLSVRARRPRSVPRVELRPHRTSACGGPASCQCSALPKTFVASVAVGTRIAIVFAHSFVSDRTFGASSPTLCEASSQDRHHG